ncbi:MAG: glycosyltransferase family 4 protein [Rhizomicrobium sp.]
MPEIDNWVYGAHGTDIDKLRAATADEIVHGRVVFSGSMLYPPNVQAVLWFVAKCWPIIRTQMPEAEFIVQGRDPVKEIRDLHGQKGITVTGTVPDVGAIIRSASVCINPVLAAGGMQNKLLEYMACEKATVTTFVANEGIQAPDDVILLADAPADFANGVLRLLSDPIRCAEIGRKARKYVLDQWTWEAHFLKLESEFYRALQCP